LSYSPSHSGCVPFFSFHSQMSAVMTEERKRFRIAIVGHVIESNYFLHGKRAHRTIVILQVGISHLQSVHSRLALSSCLRTESSITIRRYGRGCYHHASPLLVVRIAQGEITTALLALSLPSGIFLHCQKTAAPSPHFPRTVRTCGQYKLHERI
jgi:hypothetical protein